MTIRKRAGTFVATDASGKPHTIVVYQHYAVAATRGGTEEVPTLKELRTADGAAVNKVGDGEYAIVGNQMIALRSTDPNQPTDD